MALMIKANADDNSTFQQAMSSPEADAWYKAMEKEFDSLVNLDTWEEVRRDSVATNVLDSTWALKRKRYPDLTKKNKSKTVCQRRLTDRGS